MPRDRRAPAIGRLVPPSPSRADFHAHTNRSDGLLEPSTLVAAAAAAGVRTLAVTDHDTLAGYRELVAPGGPALPAGLDLVPGIEINATAPDIADLPDGELHLVGLGVDPSAASFEAVLDLQRGVRRRRFERMLARLREAGAPVDAQLEDLTLARLGSAHGHHPGLADWKNPCPVRPLAGGPLDSTTRGVRRLNGRRRCARSAIGKGAR